MRAPASSFFRDIRMPRDALNERMLLDTMAERRAEERPRGRTLRSFLSRTGILR